MTMLFLLRERRSTAVGRRVGDLTSTPGVGE